MSPRRQKRLSIVAACALYGVDSTDPLLPHPVVSGCIRLTLRRHLLCGILAILDWKLVDPGSLSGD
jgi:hypothetical protein